MTAQSTMKHKFDAEAYEKLVAHHVANYRTNEPRGSQRGAVVCIGASTLAEFLTEYAAKLSEGYTLHPHPAYTPAVSTGNGYTYVRAYLLKPEAEQAADIEAIREEVLEQYNAERKRLYQQHLDFIVQESLERERREQERKAAAAAEKARVVALKDAELALGKFE